MVGHEPYRTLANTFQSDTWPRCVEERPRRRPKCRDGNKIMGKINTIPTSDSKLNNTKTYKVEKVELQVM